MLLLFDTILKKAQAQQQALVQIKVVATEGSTYRKTGARMLIDETGSQFDLVSGGCLETHLAQHAAKVFRHGKPIQLIYDFADEDAPHWQVSLGCKGKVTLLLEKLCPQNHYAGLALYLQARRSHQPHWLSTDLRSGQAQLHTQPTQPSRVHDNTMIEAISPAPKVLVIGTGADTDAIITLAQSLDFVVTVIGCQSQSMQAFKHRFPTLAQWVTPAQLDDFLQHSPQDYALLMTHNQTLDSAYLSQPGMRQLSLVGLLGPASRKQSIVEKLTVPVPGDFDSNSVPVPDNFEKNTVPVPGDFAVPVPDNLIAPMGLDLGGHGPHAVALSVMAQLQAHYYQMSAQPLHKKNRGIHDSSQ